MSTTTIKIFDKDYPVVSKEVQQDRQYTLYLWARNVDGVQYVKFGEAFKASVWDRYDNTGDAQHLEMIAVWKSSVHDKQIHELLQKYPTESWKWAGRKSTNPLNTQEAYIVYSSKGIDDMIEFITKASKRKKIGPNFFRDRGCQLDKLKPRKYQKTVIDKCTQILTIQNKCLLNLSTRAGKSLVSLKIAKNIGANNILILTPFPSAEDSFRQLAELNKEFRGYKYLKLTRKIEPKDLCKKNVIFCSYQFYDEDKTIIQSIQNINWDLIILDESHNTSDTERTFSILNNLKYKKRLYMSGTPFNDIYSCTFSKNEIVTLDFIDFIEYSKKHPEEVSLPNLHILNVCNMKELNDRLIQWDPEVFKKTDAFKFDTIFGNDLHSNRFFHWLTNCDNSSLFTGEVEHWFDHSVQKKILSFFNTNKEVQNATIALKNVTKDPNSNFYGYDVVQISGEDGIASVSEQLINDIFSQSENGVIITTCAKLTTGVTLPALDTIWYFKNTKSSEVFVQTLFRTMTPYEGKNDVRMFCFDSEVSLNMIKDYVLIREELKETRVVKTATTMDTIKQLLNCIRFAKLGDKLEWQDIGAAELLRTTKNIPHEISSTYIFKNLSALSNCFLIGGGKRICSKPKFVASGLGGNDVDHYYHSDNNKKIDKTRKSDNFVKVCKRVLYELATIDKTIWANIDNIESHNDLMKIAPPSNIIPQNIYCQLIKDNSDNIEDAISMIKLLDSTTEGRIQLLDNLSRPTLEDSILPLEKLKKLTSVVNIDNDTTIMDPCCGPGFLLQKLAVEYGIDRSNLYGITIDHRDYSICKRLGFDNVQCGNCLDSAMWTMTTFDVAIIYPPFNKNVHIKIAAESLLHCKHVLCHSPSNWLIDMKDGNELTQHMTILDIEHSNSEWDLGYYWICRDNVGNVKEYISNFYSTYFEYLQKVTTGTPKIIDRLLHWKDADPNKYFVPLKSNINMCGHPNYNIIHYLRCIHNNIIISDDKEYCGKTVEEATKNNSHITVGSPTNFVGIELDTIESANRLIKYLESAEFLDLVKNLKTKRRVPFEILPLQFEGV